MTFLNTKSSLTLTDGKQIFWRRMKNTNEKKKKEADCKTIGKRIIITSALLFFSPKTSLQLFASKIEQVLVVLRVFNGKKKKTDVCILLSLKISHNNILIRWTLYESTSQSNFQILTNLNWLLICLSVWEYEHKRWKTFVAHRSMCSRIHWLHEFLNILLRLLWIISCEKCSSQNHYVCGLSLIFHLCFIFIWYK